MIRMTKQADYGIVLLSVLATDPDGRSSAPDLAAETGIPQPTVSKILKLLVREGLLTSHRGVKGGYALDRTPESITVADMLVALEGPIAFTECIEDAPGECSQEDVCHLRSHWQRINDAVRGALEGITLADLRQPTLPPQLVQLGGGRTAQGRA